MRELLLLQLLRSIGSSTPALLLLWLLLLLQLLLRSLRPYH
jgi:hypothetical protein